MTKLSLLASCADIEKPYTERAVAAEQKRAPEVSVSPRVRLRLRAPGCSGKAALCPRVSVDDRAQCKETFAALCSEPSTVTHETARGVIAPYTIPGQRVAIAIEAVAVYCVRSGLQYFFRVLHKVKSSTL